MSTEISEVLKRIYYNPKHSASFGSVDALYNAAKKEFFDIKRKDVEHWLSGQNAYTLHKQVRRRFPRNRIVVNYIDENWETDICDMQEFAQFNDNQRYILTVIDVFSKFAFARPLKDKSASSVVAAFENIIQTSGRIPGLLRSDEGTEYLNSQFRNLLEKYGITHITAKNKTIKCAVIERWNRTLKSKMWKYFTAKGTRRWIDVLQDLVTAYNNSYQRSIKMKPSSVNKDNEKRVFVNLYGTSSFSDMMKQRNYKTKIKTGDLVRVQHPLKPFEKGFMPAWRDRVFKVESVLPSVTKPTFRLVGERGEKIAASKYAPELQKVTNTEYRVEKILRRKRVRGQTYVLVKWLDYPESYNSWEPIENVFQL